jgi:hypothetical protein
LTTITSRRWRQQDRASWDVCKRPAGQTAITADADPDEPSTDESSISRSYPDRKLAGASACAFQRIARRRKDLRANISVCVSRVRRGDPAHRCYCLIAIARLRSCGPRAALLLIVHTGSEAAVGEGARRLLHSSRSSGLDLRSRSSSPAGVS